MYSAEKTQWERLGLPSLLLVGKHFLNVTKGIEGTGDLKSNSVNQLETVFGGTHALTIILGRPSAASLRILQFPLQNNDYDCRKSRR